MVAKNDVAAPHIFEKGFGSPVSVMEDVMIDAINDSTAGRSTGIGR
jgi:hypothetical protein